MGLAKRKRNEKVHTFNVHLDKLESDAKASEELLHLDAERAIGFAANANRNHGYENDRSIQHRSNSHNRNERQNKRDLKTTTGLDDTISLALARAILMSQFLCDL